MDVLTRAEVEDFLFHDAMLLDEWRLEEWLSTLTDDASYEITAASADAEKQDELSLLASEPG
jgi:p-cumate 2,3-dioxygenase subunit beta